MTYTPSTARRPRPQKEEKGKEQKEVPSPRKQLTLAAYILERTQLPKLGRPPKDEDEKRAVFTALAYLKAANVSNRECGEQLDVSERTVYNYLDDPLYIEIESEIQTDAKLRGHTTISALVHEALDQLFTLMRGASSEFVKFKAAEKLLDAAGYNLPPAERKREDRDEVARFLEIIKQREDSTAVRGRVQVNVQVNGQQALPGSYDVATIESDAGPEEQPALPSERAPRYPGVLPGGRLPEMAAR